MAFNRRRQKYIMSTSATLMLLAGMSLKCRQKLAGGHSHTRRVLRGSYPNLAAFAAASWNLSPWRKATDTSTASNSRLWATPKDTANLWLTRLAVLECRSTVDFCLSKYPLPHIRERMSSGLRLLNRRTHVPSTILSTVSSLRLANEKQE